MLKFTRGNAKLDALEKIVGGPVYTFSLLSGHTCPFAKNCLSKAIRQDGKTSIVDGQFTEFRCFSASEEVIYPAVYDSREFNTSAIKNSVIQADEIAEAIPSKAKCIRIHVGGDFYNQPYFDAWMNVASAFPSILFYAYTKSLPFWISARNRGIIPSNVSLTASRGGFRDSLIDSRFLREAVVIADYDTCKAIADSGNSDVVPSGKYAGYPIDHDDSHAALPELRQQSFALLIHNVQPAGSEAGKAKRVLNGVGSYKKGK